MIIKIIFITLSCLICITVLKEHKSTIALALSICGIIVLAYSIIPYFKSIYNKINEYIAVIKTDNNIFLILFKVVIIALATRLTADICRDKGEQALGFKIELAGILVGIFCSFPLLDKALSIIGAL